MCDEPQINDTSYILELEFQTHEYEIYQGLSWATYDAFLNLAIGKLKKLLTKYIYDNQDKTSLIREQEALAERVAVLHLPYGTVQHMSSLGIRTIGEMLEYSKGLLTCFNGIGPALHKNIIQRLRGMGITTSRYIGALFSENEMPYLLADFLNYFSITTFGDLERLDKEKIYRFCNYSFVESRRLLAQFEEIGVQIQEPADRLTQDIEVLSVRARNALCRNGMVKESMILVAEEAALWNMPGAGAKTVDEILTFIKENAGKKLH